MELLQVSCNLVKCVFVGSAGIFAGMGTTLNLATVPALLASSDPVPAWRVVYNSGKYTALPTIFSSSSAGLYLYYTCGDLRFLASSLLHLSVAAYTLKFMKPTNDALHAIKRAKPDEIGKDEKSLIVTWGRLQWVRTVLGVSAFAIGLHAVIYK